jgi:GTP cyclohydrolase IA
MQKQIREVIRLIGDNPDREGLIDTPIRVEKAYRKLFGGYGQSAKDVLQTSFTDGSCEEMVILKDIEFYSTCEHHMLPFFGRVHIGYLPNNKVVGISKLARLVEVFARRLQIQERLTAQLVDSIMDILDARGAIAIVEAQHFCMTARGVEKQNSKMVTSGVRGLFEKAEVKNEFLSLIRK